MLNDMFTTVKACICISHESFGSEKRGFSTGKTHYFVLIISGMKIFRSIVLLGKFTSIKKLIKKRISHNQTNFHMNNWLISRK